MSASQLADDAVDCVAAGAQTIHLHPRGADGTESLEPDVVNTVVEQVRSACGVPVGVSTGAWIVPEPNRRAELVAGWEAPEFASVNLSEPGAVDVMQACLSVGVGVEAGIWSVEDAERLAASGLAHRVLRVLVELIDLQPADAIAQAEAIHRALDRHGVRAPRLQHGEGPATWPMLISAIQSGFDTRIGFEDTLQLMDGTVALSNSQLVRTAVELTAGR